MLDEKFRVNHFSEIDDDIPNYLLQCRINWISRFI